MGVKFRMEFTNAQDTLCVVKFDFSDYNDEAILLFGGPRPFVLQEFNSDEDLFKPVRPMQATIELLASAAGVDLEDFLTDDDQTVKVRFDFGQYEDYWVGYLSQEDIQETWIATNHILTLRADDGIGRLKTIPLADGENPVIGNYTPLDYIQYAMQNSAIDFLNARICSNLFHTSMTFAANQTGIDQCTIDARTFEQAPTEFEDSYRVLEKINRSWSQTIFQWWGDWFIMRLEELFVPTTTNLVGFQLNKPMIGQRASISRRWDINVGVNELVKPIAPEMLKSVIKPSKETQINYDWEEHAQVACNESFKYGDFVETTGTVPNETDKYTVDSWLYQKSPASSPTPATGTFQRLVVFKDYKLDDEYVSVSQDSTGASTFIRTCDIYVNAGDEFSFDFQYKLPGTVGGSSNLSFAFIQLVANDSTYYTLDDDGKWYLSNSNWTVNFKQIIINLPGGTGDEWASFDLTSQVPKSGYINVCLVMDANSPYTEVHFKDFNIDILPNIQKFRRRLIKGDYDKYTIQRDVAKNYLETVYLDDSESGNYKGALKEMDGFTLTGDEWYRRRYSSERYTFKRHHAIARWWMNRNYKAKLECNFYGLEWGTSGNSLPIGLMNTIKFVDDAPTKVFAIANLREIDFMSATWAANLIEIYDSSVEGDVPGDTDVHSFDFYYE
jgi:hypothetical protein